MFGILSTARLVLLVGTAFAGFLMYSWGFEVIKRYTEMPAKIQQLERDKTLITSRVASYQTLLARRDAAIAASQCKKQIEHWVKNPDEIPTKFDPFNQLN